MISSFYVSGACFLLKQANCGVQVTIKIIGILILISILELNKNNKKRNSHCIVRPKS
jgi:hypothetical protein